MMHRHAFEALDRTLRDIIGKINIKTREIPFGNKIFFFCVDFRQILPVVKNGTDFDIVNAVQLLISGSAKKEAQDFADF